jgi:hypothetical protein
MSEEYRGGEKPTKQESHAENTRFHALLPGLIVAVLVGFLVSGVGIALANPTPSSYSDIKVQVTTSTSLGATYQIGAYNMSGFLIASTQTRYQAGAFELPDGDYIVTVTALQETSQNCPIYAGASPASNGQAVADILPPCYWSYPAVEYGYSKVHVSGSTNVQITTQSFDKLSTTDLTITAKFLNGTAAAGASVSASVLGGTYWWNVQGNRLTMWGQTGKDGVAHLIVPTAPVTVSAWDWLQVHLPQKETTVQTNVGGETINVTVYWQPSYVGLAASTLIIPPQSSADLTLRYQQPNYWMMPYAAKSAATPGIASSAGTISNAPGGIPADQAQIIQAQSASQNFALGLPPNSSIPQATTTVQVPASSGPTSQPPVSNDQLLLIAGIGAAAIVLSALSIAIAIRIKK